MRVGLENKYKPNFIYKTSIIVMSTLRHNTLMENERKDNKKINVYFSPEFFNWGFRLEWKIY